MSEKLNPEALKEVVDHLHNLAAEMRANSQSYKNMFDASEKGIRGLLDKLDHDMTSLVLDACHAIKERFGVEISNDLFYFLMGQAFFRQVIEEDIQLNEGLTCSVDKARQLAARFALDQLVNPKKKKELR